MGYQISRKGLQLLGKYFLSCCRQANELGVEMNERAEWHLYMDLRGEIRTHSSI